jgi:hypothetical protein
MIQLALARSCVLDGPSRRAFGAPQRLCWRSSGFWAPWLFVSQDGVEDGEEFAGRGDDDEHFGFACVNEARAQRPKDEPASPPLPRPQSYQKTRKPSYKDEVARVGMTTRALLMIGRR